MQEVRRVKADAGLRKSSQQRGGARGGDCGVGGDGDGDATDREQRPPDDNDDMVRPPAPPILVALSLFAWKMSEFNIFLSTLATCSMGFNSRLRLQMFTPAVNASIPAGEHHIVRVWFDLRRIFSLPS